jgi:hypothetical protein
MKRLIPIFFLLSALAHATSVPVSLAPVAKQQFFDSSGRTLSFGCVFTYQSGTTTPLASYTDSTGTVQNTNPIILTAGGFAGSTGSSAFFIQAGVAYTVKVVSQGGTNCSLGTTQYTIDGVGGGLTLNTTVATCTGTCPSVIAGQTQLFEITLTGNTTANPISAVGITPPATVYWELIQDSGGSHSWTWPSNSRGGCTIASAANAVTVQAFVWDGTNAQAIGPCVTNNGPNINTGTITATGSITTAQQFISTLATGTPPIVVASTTQVANLNVSQLEGFTWEVPGTIGSTTPNTGAFSTFRLNGGTIQTAMQGTDTHIQTAGTVASSNPNVCTDANGGITTTCTTTGPVFAPQSASTAGLPVSITANSQITVLTKAVTFPAAAGTYRADIRSGIWITAGPNACASEVIDATNSKAYASANSQNANGSGFIGIAGAQITSQTYAAGASVTFNLAVICNANSTATLNWSLGTATLSPNAASFLDITPVLSN